MRIRHAAVLVAIAALSVSCGTAKDTTPPVPSTTTPTVSVAPTPTKSPTKTPTKPAVVLPKCASVWVANARLSARYSGCLDAGKTVPANGMRCVVGHDLVVYRDQFYAMTSGKIFRPSGNLRSDSGYQLTLDLCRHGAPTS
jgi:hypothetical protein